MSRAIQNIIFDLGGVFLNIDFERTNQAFQQLGLAGFDRFFTQHHAHQLFEDLETGKISPDQFYAAFRAETQTQLTDAQIRDAWNALLLDFPPERLDWLEKIRQHYRVFLFSNTNAIHYDAFMAQFAQVFPGKDFNAYFEKAYYSQTLGLRKPEPESFQAILTEQDLDPAVTLFIDDTPKNVEAAQQVGLQAWWLSPGKSVLDLDL